MNKQEFLELRDEQLKLITAYDLFCKKGFLIDLNYTFTFSEYLRKDNKLKQENQILLHVMELKNEGKDYQEFLVKAKENYEKSDDLFVKKYDYAKLVLEKTKSLDKEATLAFNTKYRDFVDLFHPALKFKVNKSEGELFDRFRKAFIDNNVELFDRLYEASQELFKRVEFDEKDYTTVSTYWYSLRAQINQDVSARANKYPYVAEGIFKDEITIAQEAGNYRVNLKKIEEANKKIHEDYKALIGEDFKL